MVSWDEEHLISFLIVCIHPPFVWEQYWKHPMPYSFWKKSSWNHDPCRLLKLIYVSHFLWNIISCHSYCVGKWLNHDSVEALAVTAAAEQMSSVVELIGSARLLQVFPGPCRAATCTFCLSARCRRDGMDGCGSVSLRLRIRFVPLQHRKGGEERGGEEEGRNGRKGKCTWSSKVSRLTCTAKSSQTHECSFVSWRNALCKFFIMLAHLHWKALFVQWEVSQTAAPAIPHTFLSRCEGSVSTLLIG